MATQTILLSATSKRGAPDQSRPKSWRETGWDVQAGGAFGNEMRSKRLPIRGDLNRLANFATRQPGLFIKWVDAKFGLK